MKSEDQVPKSTPAAALADFEAVETHRVMPHPDIVKTIGLNHKLESAIADLVDNSIDASADRVLIRFVFRGGLVRQLLVIDNGAGMSETEIDEAMQLGKPKEMSEGALGHFGMGLKAASFSQAAELTVLSQKRGCPAQGRRMVREGAAVGFEVEVLDGAKIGGAFENLGAPFDTPTGTIVRWDSIRTFPASKDPNVTNEFVERKVGELRHYLGLMFHRLIEAERVTIEIDEFDGDTGFGGFAFNVEPIDPFGYARSGVSDYPKTLTAEFHGRSIPLACHIWPGGSDSQFFKIAGAPVERYQGFYFYRNDRLLSAGGWGGVISESKRLKLARVAIDIEENLDGFSMSVEKSTVHMVADLVNALEEAQSEDGVSFSDYRIAAEAAFKTSNQRTRRRVPILPPGQGMASRVKRAIAKSADVIEGEEPIQFRWTVLDDDQFVEVDRNERTLWLNSTYREAVLKGNPGSLNDAPIIKTLLFLLYEDIFRGAAFGPKDKDNVTFWNTALAAAAEAEWRQFDE